MAINRVMSVSRGTSDSPTRPAAHGRAQPALPRVAEPPPLALISGGAAPGPSLAAPSARAGVQLRATGAASSNPETLPVLRVGARSDDVRYLQQLLASTGAQIAVDGDFGPGTLRAVKAFQASQALSQDGVVGAATWGALLHAAQRGGQRRADLPDPAATFWDRFSSSVQLRRAPSGARPFVDGVSARDANQGHVGDCYFIASMASVAHVDPKAIEEMITDNGDGTYTVRLYDRSNRRQEITVDDDFYYSGSQPLYGHGANRQELWPALLEKAYAQVWGGYDGIGLFGGTPNAGFRALTGRSSTTYRTAGDPETAWQAILQAQREHRPMAASTSSGAPSRGIQGNHIYSVLGGVEEGGQRYVIIRNPHGQSEFHTTAYDSDVVFEGIEDRDDGIFRITVDDFFRCYSALVIRD